MLRTKIAKYIEDHITSDSDKILIIEGARQIGKSYMIRTMEDIFALFRFLYGKNLKRRIICCG